MTTTTPMESTEEPNELCYLHYLGAYEHIVVAEMPTIEPERTVELPGYEPVLVSELQVTEVIDNSPAAARQLSVGDTFEVSVYTGGLADAYLADAFAEGARRTLFLRPDYQGASEFQAYVLDETADGLKFTPNDCEYATNLQKLASAIGRPVSDVELLVDLRHMQTDRVCSLATCSELDSWEWRNL